MAPRSCSTSLLSWSSCVQRNNDVSTRRKKGACGIHRGWKLVGMQHAAWLERERRRANRAACGAPCSGFRPSRHPPYSKRLRGWRCGQTTAGVPAGRAPARPRRHRVRRRAGSPPGSPRWGSLWGQQQACARKLPPPPRNPRSTPAFGYTSTGRALRLQPLHTPSAAVVPGLPTAATCSTRT